MDESQIDDIHETLSRLNMAMQVQAGLAKPEFLPDGSISLRIVTQEEWEERNTTPARTTKIIPVEPSVRGEGRMPFVWVFTCPPPYNGVEIVCVPDSTTNIGIRCTASAPNMNRERDKYQIVFLNEEEARRRRW